jgi:response regulator RpfG family c-di-GMP phosphodiesterase
LVVDDASLYLDALGKLLSRRGYEVIPASRPDRALELIRSQVPVDVLLSDINMPGIQGTELVRQVSQLSPATACMLMTGATVELAEIPPGVPVLHKPILSQDLFSAVEKAIAQSIELKERFKDAIESSARLHGKARQLCSESADLIAQALHLKWQAGLEREQRNGASRHRSLRREIGNRFLITLPGAALKFFDSIEIALNEETTSWNVHYARTVYETIAKIMRNVTLDDRHADAIKEGLARLRVQLEAAGEQF